MSIGGSLSTAILLVLVVANLPQVGSVGTLSPVAPGHAERSVTSHLAQPGTRTHLKPRFMGLPPETLIAHPGVAAHERPVPKGTTSSPHSPYAAPAQTTSINGTVSIDGTLLSDSTSLSGGFSDSGSAMTVGYTTTTGTAGYGTTRILGGLTIQGTSGSPQPALITNPGSSLYMDPPSSATAATISMQGDLSLGNGTTGDTFLLNQQGTPMSVWSNASGGIYGWGGQTTITSGSDIALTNYGPGTLTINGCLLVCPITIAPGSTYTPCYPIIGCISASSSSITWTAPISFNIQGTVTTSSPGLYADFPESHLAITVPPGVGANFSMLPAQGSPTILVRSGAVTPAYVSTSGDLLMTGGEDLAADVTVSGTFEASHHVFVNGTFHNTGGLTIHGNMVSQGAQYFPGYLFLGPVFHVSTASSSNITVTGLLAGDSIGNGTSTIDLEGSMVSSGNLSLAGYFQQNSSVSTITGNLSTSGTLYAHGSIVTTGHTELTGPFSARGNLTLPNVFVDGGISATWSQFVSVTRVNLTGSLAVTGDTLLTNGSFASSGGSTIVGNLSTTSANLSTTGILYTDGTIQTTGRTELIGPFSAEGNMALPNTFLGGGLSATSATFLSLGNVDLKGLLTVNGTTVIANDSFTASGNSSIVGDLSTNSGNLSTEGRLYAYGSIVNTGKTEFLGTFSAQGNLTMPNAFLGGRLSATWCTLTGLGSTNLTGSLTVDGTTLIDNGSFTSSGKSAIVGNIVGNKSDTLTGNSTMTTLWGENLSLTSHVTMGGVATIVGSIGVQGVISTNGTSSFTPTTVNIASAVTVDGSSYSRGSISVQGITYFTGEVKTSGNSTFPGMNLSGNFSLASAGGSVLGSGTSGVKGTVTLSGVLEVTPSKGGKPGVFHESGYSSITGSLRMTGKVVVTGDTRLTTSRGALLYMWGNITLGTAANIIGTVNVSGEVGITGSATLSSSAVVINGTLDQVGEVYSEGDITLIGNAFFQGSVDTYGTTVLPGITTAGSLELTAGSFLIAGVIHLQGSTTAFGNVTVNSTGYYVVGSDTIRGRSVATGYFSESGPSTLTGYATIGAGSRLGTYMKVIGHMNTGGLSLSGTTILPDDEVTFTDGANITGVSQMNGLLVGTGTSVTFQGSSVVTGSVTSSSMPEISGPVVLSFLGGYFAMTLGWEFYAFIALLIAALVLGLAEALLGMRARMKRLPRAQASGTARVVKFSGLLLTATGVFAGLGGGFLVGSTLASQPMTGDPSTVATLYWAASGLTGAGIVLWMFGSVLSRRERRSRLQEASLAPPAGYPSYPMQSYYPPVEPDYPPMQAPPEWGGPS